MITIKWTDRAEKLNDQLIKKVGSILCVNIEEKIFQFFPKKLERMIQIKIPSPYHILHPFIMVEKKLWVKTLNNAISGDNFINGKADIRGGQFDISDIEDMAADYVFNKIEEYCNKNNLVSTFTQNNFISSRPGSEIVLTKIPILQFQVVKQEVGILKYLCSSRREYYLTEYIKNAKVYTNIGEGVYIKKTPVLKNWGFTLVHTNETEWEFPHFIPVPLSLREEEIWIFLNAINLATKKKLAVSTARQNIVAFFKKRRISIASYLAKTDFDPMEFLI